MSANELRCGMHHDVRAMLDGSEQIRSSEGIVNYQGKTVLVSDLSDRIHVWNITVGVAKGLQVNGSGVLLNCSLYFSQIMCIHKGGRNSVLGKGVGQQVEASTVDGLLRYHVTTVCCQCLDRVSDGCRAGSKCQGCAAALQCGDPLLKDVLCGVGQSAVDITCIRKTETVCSVLAVMEYIGSGLVNGYCPGIGCGVCLLLSNM